jgi:hypothetical protein
MDLREIEWDGMDWIDLAQNRDQWRAVWIGSIWLRIGTSGGPLWTRYWTFGFHDMLESSWVAAQLTASQEGLSSMSEPLFQLQAYIPSSSMHSVSHLIAMVSLTHKYVVYVKKLCIDFFQYYPWTVSINTHCGTRTGKFSIANIKVRQGHNNEPVLLISVLLRSILMLLSRILRGLRVLHPWCVTLKGLLGRF